MRASIRLVCSILLLGAWGAADPARAAGPETDRLRVLEDSAGDFTVGLAAHRRGDLDGAIRAYGLAVAKDPRFVEALVNLARALADSGELHRAERWLDRARSVRPDYYGLFKVGGLVALRRGQPDLAVDELERALSLRPDDAEALTNLGAALLLQGRVAEARGHLEAAVDLDPGSARAALNLAVAWDRSGEPGAAAYYYRRFLELSAEDDAARTRADVRDRLELLHRAAGTPADAEVPPSFPPLAATPGPREETR